MSEQQRAKDVATARPTGKRQLAGTSTTSTTSAEVQRTQSKAAQEKEGNKVVSFLPEVVTEMKKVIWPTGKQMVQYTLVVFAFLIVVTGLVAGIDFLAGLGVEKILSR